MAHDLATLLSLQPLDRLQIADRSELHQMRRQSEALQSPEDLPFWFLQQVLPDGRLEVAASSGYLSSVSPLDVCDIRREPEPIIVKAMPRSTFIQRQCLPSGKRAAPTSDEFQDAFVLRVSIGRGCRIDQCVVLFVDQWLNAGGPFNAPLADGEAERLNQLRREKGLMPVAVWSDRRANFGGSTRGVRHQATKTQRRSGAFLQAALLGDSRRVRHLCADLAG